MAIDLPFEKLFLKIIFTGILSLIIFNAALSQNNQIHNLDIAGAENNVICLASEQDYFLEFEQEEQFEDGAEFVAFAEFNDSDEPIEIGRIPAGADKAIPISFPDMEGLVNPGDIFIEAVVNDEVVQTSDSLSVEVVNELDEGVELNIYNYTVTPPYHPDDNMDLIVFGAQSGAEYKVVHVESGTSATDWQTEPPFSPFYFHLNGIVPGEYRLYGRVVRDNVVCQDSVMLESHIILDEEDFVEEPYVMRPALPGAENTICLVDEPDLSLEFEVAGEFPEGTEIRAVAESIDNSYILGSIPAGAGTSIPLTFPEDIVADDNYDIKAQAFYDEEVLAQSGSLMHNIIPVVDPNISIDSEGDVYLCSGESLEISLTEGQRHIFYKIVHESTSEGVTEWEQFREGPLSFIIEEPQPGEYRVYGRGRDRATGNDICQANVPLDAVFNVNLVDEKPVGLEVNLDNGNDIHPDDNGEYVVCPDQHVSLEVTEFENATYLWYKNGEKLEEDVDNELVVNQNMYGSGEYSVRIVPADNEDCPYASEPVSIIFEEPEASINQENGHTLQASEGHSYQWYRNGEQIEGAISRTFEPSESGVYQVEVEFSPDCFAMSEGFKYTVTSVNPEKQNSFEMFPNPAKDNITIKFHSGSRPNFFEIRDLTGTVRLSNEISGSGHILNIDISSLQSGFYCIYIYEGEEVYVQKVIKK